MKTYYEVKDKDIEKVLLDLKWMFDEFDVYASIKEDETEIYKRDFTFYRGDAYNYENIRFSTEDGKRNLQLLFEVPNTNQEDLQTWLLINEIIKTIFLHPNDAVFFKGLDLRYKYVNQVFRKIHNASSMCLVNLHHSDVFGPKYIFPIDKEIYVLNTKQATEAVMNFNSDYKNISYKESITPIFDDRGDLFCICSIAKDLVIDDINDIKLIIKRDLKELLNQLGIHYFEYIGDFDHSLELLEEMVAKLGYDDLEVEVIKPTVIDYIHEEDRQIYLNRYSEQALNQGNFSYAQNLRIRAKDGSYRWFKYFEKILYDKEPNFVAGVYIDIDDVMNTREEAIRTAKEKAMFLAGMSHEIRTPLNAILGFSELLSQLDLKDKEKDYAEKIKSAVVTLIQLINNVLDYSKIEAGKLEAEILPFNLHDSLSFIQSIMDGKAREKGIQFKLLIHPEVESDFAGDELRINQILTNLCSNAVKFTDEGYVKLEVSKEDSNIVFSVIDTGIGMSRKKLDKIFEDFTQAEKSTSRRYGGTGLGLSISKQLATLLGGEIMVESTLGKGSKFIFTCPIFKIIEKEVNRPVFDFKALSNAYVGNKILLVEDVANNQEIVKETLSPLGIELVIANDGLEAIQILKSNESFNLILMDLQMPVMDGFDATKEIRHFYSADQLPIIALTADSSLMTLRRTFEYKMQAYLLKPVTAQTLIQTIIKHLPNLNIIINTENIDQALDNQLEELSELLNVNDALERFENNKQLLLTLVEDYAHSYDHIPLDFKSDNEEVRFFHNLKGISGNLGVNKVQELAEKIESCIVSNTDSDDLRILLNQQLKELSSKILSIISNQEPQEVSPETQTHSNQDFHACKDHLMDALTEHALESETILINNTQVISDQIGEELYDEILRNVRAYDFSHALKNFEEGLDG